MSLVVDALVYWCNVSTIALCGFMKLPQIYNIKKQKSVKGLSLLSLSLELSSYCITLSYNIFARYDLINYLEYPLMVAQDVAMIALVLSMTNRLSVLIVIPAMFGTLFAYGIATGTFPQAFILLLVTLCTPISASSKIFALMEIVRVKNSQAVSIAAWSISSYTCLTRIFTIYVESADFALLLNFGTSLVLNLMIIATAYYYKPKRAKTD